MTMRPVVVAFVGVETLMGDIEASVFDGFVIAGRDSFSTFCQFIRIGLTGIAVSISVVVFGSLVEDRFGIRLPGRTASSLVGTADRRLVPDPTFDVGLALSFIRFTFDSMTGSS